MDYQISQNNQSTIDFKKIINNMDHQISHNN